MNLTLFHKIAITVAAAGIAFAAVNASSKHADTHPSPPAPIKAAFVEAP